MAKEATTTQIVPLKDIREHMVFLKDGSLRAVLDVSAINFELRSSDEQVALTQNFQGFLNSIDFRLQILVQSRKYDIEEYIEHIQEQTNALENDMLKVQAEEYIRFVRELSELANIMKKRFLVVIPVEVFSAPKASNIMEDIKSMFGKKKGAKKKESGHSEDELRAWQMQLAQRADLVMAGLSGMGLKSRLLEQQELMELFTQLYNPEVPDASEKKEQ